MLNKTKITVNVCLDIPDEVASRAAKVLDWWMKDNFMTEESASYHWEEVKEAMAEKLFLKMQEVEHEGK